MREMSSLELQCAVRELNGALAGARVQKFYELGDGEFRLELHTKGKGTLDLAVELKRRIGATKYIRPAPKEPTQFAMQMRKRLDGAAITKVEQYGMDRVAYFEMERGGEKMRLLFEMFSDGNLILTDGEGMIIAAYRHEEWKDRVIRPRSKYIFPATGKVNPFDLSAAKLRDLMNEKKIVACLAQRVNLGPNYVEEVLKRAEIPFDRQADKLTDKELWKLMDGFVEVFWGLSRPEPVICYKDGKPFDYAPFPLSRFAGAEVKKFKTMSEMLDEFYITTERAPQPESELEKKRKKLEFALGEQRAAVSALLERAAEAKLAGDRLYEKYQEAEALLEAVRRRRNEKAPWDEIERELAGKVKIDHAKGRMEAEL